MGTQRVFLVALVASVVSVAGAAVVPVDEFSGDLWEGFEAIYAPGAYPGPIPIFEGQATFDDTLAHMVVISYVWQGPAGVVHPYNGNLFSGGVVGPEFIQFATPVSDFGGYFTTVGATGDGQIKFYDGEGLVFETMPMTIVPGEWLWQGWHSDVPVTAVEIIGGSVPGVSVQCDDLVATLVPEPTTAGLIAVAGLFRRRRR